MSPGDDSPPPPPAIGAVETEVLAEMARAAGGLTVEMGAPSARAGGLRILRGGRGTAVDAAADADADARAMNVPQSGGETTSAETVVLLHGRGHAASIWFPCWPALAARHRLLAMDLPGFGGSLAAGAAAAPAFTPRPSNAEQGLAFFADPVESLLMAEARARPARGFALIGHSLGALVALELALRGQLPIRRLVLIDGMGLGPAMTFASRLFFRLHPERLARALGARLFGRLNPSPPTPLGRRLAALEHELLCARAPARAAAARAFDRLCPLVGPAFHRRRRLAEVAAPVLLLWGERDAALPLANARAARAAMPRSTLLTFPLGHSPHLEAPELIAPPLLEWLSAV